MVRRLAVAIAVIASSLVVSAGTANAATVFYVTKGTRVGPGINRAVVRASCPKRWRVVSGGVEIEGGVRGGNVVASYPFDNRDRNRIPDDGWVGITNNKSALSTVMRTFAVCVKTAGYVYNSSATTISGAALTLTSAGCPADMEVIGGGASVSGKSPYIELVYSTPTDTDGDDVRNNGWGVGVRNRSGAEQTIIRHAICAPENLAHTTFESDVPDGQKVGVGQQCADNRELVGGGVVLSTALDNDLMSTKPTFSTSFVSNDGWLAESSNTSGATRSVSVTVICRPI
jgi:hypothetical protein